jgi:cytochrome P450
VPDAPSVPVDPFATTVHRLHEPAATSAALHTGGPIVRAEAPAGGPVWIITEEALARQVLADPRLAKDTAFAPAGWDRATAGLEPPAAEQLSLTTLDGGAHAALRRAHTPLFTARRIRDHADRIEAIARELLTEHADEGGVVDLVADFTVRFPLTVICDLLGVPRHDVDRAVAACQGMTSSPDAFAASAAVLRDVGAAALHTDEPNPARELLDRVPDGTSEEDVHYLLFGMIFAGQVTTESALGFLLAQVLGGGRADIGTDELVRDTLRRHPPAPFTLWRFTTTELDIAGVRLPARAPVLVDIEGINARLGDGPDLTFGAGAHYCIGAQLAHRELHAAATVLQTDFPAARLAVPFDELRRVGVGIMGRRLTTLPVMLCPRADGRHGHSREERP